MTNKNRLYVMKTRKQILSMKPTSKKVMAPLQKRAFLAKNSI